MSPPAFFRLPREIRLMIYSHSLISSFPISVWPATTLCGQGSPTDPVPNSRLWDVDLGLLRCNSAIAAEAAAVFYGGNTFRIHGDDLDYRLAVNWLKQIGIQNRGYLATLEMRIWIPGKAFQLTDGTRIREYKLGRLFSRHPHLAAPLLSCPDGQVDVIDPLLETIIALVGQAGGRRLTLHLNLGLLDIDIIPGIKPAPDRKVTEGLSMDLPNLLETWRAQYTSDDRCRNVDILWRAYTYKCFFIDNKTLIEDLGWQILEAKEDEWSRAETPRTGFTTSSVRLCLKRKKLTEKLTGPKPYFVSRNLRNRRVWATRS
ncbi:MAG: hypothetical protein L6R40_004084 [Gallowayella cf. fulva]|nr:MAG: hypothetical protein L6R40_004084 [Xanthomendoza cf. fulva]